MAHEFAHMIIIHDVVATSTHLFISKYKLLNLYKYNCMDFYISSAPTFNIFVNDHAHVKKYETMLWQAIMYDEPQAILNDDVWS